MLDDVDVDLVALVLYALRTPARHPRRLLRQLLQLLNVIHGLRLQPALLDVPLQQLRVRYLRDPVVADFFLHI